MSRILKILRPAASLTKRYGSQKGGGQSNWQYRMRKLGFELAIYKRYGLYTDDVLDYEPTVVHEALRRLPKDVLDARNFRLIRALQLDVLKQYLPREKWITYEQDLEYRYLQPYIQEINAEKTEIYEFGCPNYAEDDWPYHELK
ncbi:cytochrome b-c1 complex subunit 7-like [Ceratina calcarata]|uniref:Cytochrome b-c1 complex subunit 7 n=1 Tax=Ceratina calcarata TaxID=156304 RepID=A0AAJ7N5M6_9HYME|nr:cytochrome b-c1 complex subunit 7-like [Ceratina calcarata]